jgi:arginase
MIAQNFTVLGVPFNGIGVPPEQENPAQAIRDAGMINLLEMRGASVVDLGDLEIPPFDGYRDERNQVLNLAAWRDTSVRLSNRLGELLDRDSTFIILGGDCGILLGIIGAFVQRGRSIGLVMLDGHADFRSPESSPSGEAADLPLWVLTGRGPSELCGLYGRHPMIEDGEITVLGFREPDMIDQSSITRFDRKQIAKIGIAKATELGLQPIVEQGLDIWLHFDVDVIDPLEMPAVHFPESGGLSMREAADISKRVVDTQKVRGLSLACYHNGVDADGTAGIKLARLVSDILT